MKSATTIPSTTTGVHLGEAAVAKEFGRGDALLQSDRTQSGQFRALDRKSVLAREQVIVAGGRQEFACRSGLWAVSTADGHAAIKISTVPSWTSHALFSDPGCGRTGDARFLLRDPIVDAIT